ncbi:hypothetical protein E2C01_019660 [Portunus trituberculatus]|uniref:Uncharacterized protein n=1 Tax=Portunus trituberculatus TaxID=210409 RepID=A0A5B7DZZ4_PORTR|nr:hypothetical protein [Portunus trituberculatus]
MVDARVMNSAPPPPLPLPTERPEPRQDPVGAFPCLGEATCRQHLRGHRHAGPGRNLCRGLK